jgi:hypothetical protein
LAGNTADYGGGAYSGTLNNCTLTGNTAYVGGGAYSGTLNDCILAENSAQYDGGGAYDGTLNNCTFVGNWASRGGGAFLGTVNNCTLSSNTAYEGGGAYRGRLNDCTLTANSAHSDGGGAYVSTLNNCVLIGNSASYGGGAAWGTLHHCTLTANSATNFGGGAYFSGLDNCIVYYNTAAGRPNRPNYEQSSLNYSCTTPLPLTGSGNITNEPRFVSLTEGDLRLHADSPCINAGHNPYPYAPGSTDLDGDPRIAGGTVDMGAYEFQSPASLLSYAWLQQYGLPTDGSADHTDSDADGHNNWQEWRCLTEPTDALSALRLLSVAPAGTGVAVTWQSVPGVSYFLECSPDLSAASSFTTIATNVAAQGSATIYPHIHPPPGPRLFYRVGVGH